MKKNAPSKRGLSDVSFITPHLLMGSKTSRKMFKTLEEMGVGLIINMRFFHKDKIRFIPVLWSRTLDVPVMPISSKFLFKGAEEASDLIKQNKVVFVHCMQGKYRSSIMTAAILICLGFSADEAIKIIKKGRSTAKPDAPYVKKRILRFYKEWLKNSNE